MMKRCIVDSWRVGHPGVDIELFYIKSVEISSTQATPISGWPEVLQSCKPIKFTQLTRWWWSDASSNHDASDIRARILNCFTSSQSRYLVLRLHPYLGDLRFYKVVNPWNLLNLPPDDEAMHRRFMTRRTSGRRHWIVLHQVSRDI